MITWTDWPARRRPLRAFTAVAVIVLTVAVFSSLSPIYGGLAAFVLLTITAEVLLPTRFTLTGDGVEAFNLFRHARRPWARFTGWRGTSEGFHLKGNGSIEFIARRRSLFLSNPDDSAAVESLLSEQLGNQL